MLNNLVKIIGDYHTIINLTMQKFFLIFLLLFSAPALAKTYDFEIKKQDVFITGKAVEAITVNGQIPAPTLYLKKEWQEKFRQCVQEQF